MQAREHATTRHDGRNARNPLRGMLVVVAALAFSFGCAATRSTAESADRAANNSHKHFKHSIRREASFVNDKLGKVSNEGKRLVGAGDERKAPERKTRAPQSSKTTGS